MFEKFVTTFLDEKLGKLAEFEPLAKHTTLRVGGPARVFVWPSDKKALVQVVKLVRELGLKFKVLGKGSNILISDDVFEGVVIQTDKALGNINIEDTLVTAGAGVTDVKLARQVAKLGLSGLEFLSGVPGTIGGAVYMNAGAYLRETSDILVRAQIINEKSELVWLEKEELGFSYRTSIFQQKPEWIVVEAVFALKHGNRDEILATIKKRKEKRVISQPLELPSAGSTFRNPEGHSAWELIADTGLRGYTVGGAKISDKHANFVVNVDDATAQDVADVIAHVKKTIGEKKGLEIREEVELFNWK